MKTMTDSNVMFFHGKTVDGSRFTIAGLMEGDLTIGIAVCGDKEQFSKVKGRLISSGRILNQRNGNHKGRLIKFVPLSHERLFTFFNSEMSKYNNFTKKELLQEFGLREK